MIIADIPTAMSDDDFFGEQTGPESDRFELTRELSKLERLHVATGFRDAADGARGRHLQAGFDAGFAAGAKAVEKGAFWMGVAAVLDAAAVKDGKTMHTGLKEARLELRRQIRAFEVDGVLDSVDEAEGVCREAAVPKKIDASAIAERQRIETSSIRQSEEKHES
jgi:hypothetical protein